MDTAIKNRTKEIANEVKSLVNSIEKRENDANVVKIALPDSTGKLKTIVVDVRDPNLNPEHKNLAEKAIYENEQRKVDKELTQALKEFDTTQEKILQNEIFDEAVRLELSQLNTLSGNELRAIGLENPGATLKQIEDIQKQKLKEKIAVNADRINELNSLQIENRVNELNQNGKLSQGKNGPIAQTVKSTYEYFQEINIETEIDDLKPESKKAIAREALQHLKDYQSADQFANDTQSALCNVISAWEAGILANRSPEKVNRNFAEFYKEQVLAGNIKKDNYGETVGVFYNSDKPYLEPTTLLATKDRDLYSPAGKQEAKDILNSTDARVAQIYLDYDGDKSGNHFIIAYKNAEGEWILKDHNQAKGSKVGISLIDALDAGKIKDIRLVHEKRD
ncbi:hypothetical protein LEP1GSC196_0191 [Leptospira meyeri serovar Semaranga str. Veldrot Semarang 173]|nr:hypothetical protein LEP1GSC196_0191 [Leptospira meyeri serovar Semaranga str. Veldrot Semarang 173]